MKISIYPPLFIHEIGQRPNQEDSIAQWDNRLFVLCDGMGGHEKGEVASQTICQSLVRWFEQSIQEVSFTDDQLRDALEYAYTELDKYDDGNPRKMGTTLTLLYLHNKGVTAAHIGDSRIYHIRPSKLDEGILYQSRDHSLVFDLFQAGEITYEEMATFPQKNIVTRAMTPGENNRMRPDIIHITDILPDEYFYMCSDGMLERMDNDQLVALLSSQLTDEEKRNKLIEFTKCNQDNHSAWIIHIKDVITEEGDDKLVNEESTARCNVINIIPQVVVEDGDDAVVEDNNDVVIVKEAPKELSFYKRIQNLFSFIKNKKK
jgi:protein phosphatase